MDARGHWRAHEGHPHGGEGRIVALRYAASDFCSKSDDPQLTPTLGGGTTLRYNLRALTPNGPLRHPSVMLMLTALLLQATSPSVPAMVPTRAMGVCVVEKVKEWASSSEEAKVIVRAAMQACSSHQSSIRSEIAQYIQQGAPSLPGRQKMEVLERMYGTTQETVEGWGYEALIKARQPG